MKRFEDHILAAAMLVLQLFSAVVSAMVIRMTGHLLSDFTYAAITALGLLLGFGLLTVWLCLQKDMALAKEHVWEAMSGLLSVTGILTCFDLAFFACVGLTATRPGIAAAGMMLSGILALVCLHRLLKKSRTSQQWKERGRGWLYLAGVLLIRPLAYAAFQLLYGRGAASVLQVFGLGVVWAFLAYLFTKTVQKGLPAKGYELSIPGDPPDKKRIVAKGAAVLLLGLLSLNALPFSPSPEHKAKERLEEPLASAVAYMEAEYWDQAMDAMDLLFARGEYFLCVARNADASELGHLYAQNKADPVIAALYASATEDPRDLEYHVREHFLEDDFAYALLRLYEGERALTEEQEALRDTLLLECIGRRQFTRPDILLAEDLYGVEDKISKAVEPYGNRAFYWEPRIYKEYAYYGDFQNDLILGILEDAEEYPDNAWLQWMGLTAGTRYVTDLVSRDVLQQISDCVERFDRLLPEAGVLAEDLGKRKQQMGCAMLLANDYEKALGYFEDAASEETVNALCCAYLNIKLERYDDCLRWCGRVLETDRENIPAEFLKACAYICMEDTDSAIETAGELSERLKSGDPDCERYVYTLAHYLSQRDASLHGDGFVVGELKYAGVERMTEEQIEKAKSYEMLWNYMMGMYHYYQAEGKHEIYETGKGYMDKIIACNEKLPLAWFLRGNLFYTMGEYEEALVNYKAARQLGLDTMPFYYSLANLYRSMGKEELALMYFDYINREHRISLFYDPYGLLINADWIAEDLRKELGELQ